MEQILIIRALINSNKFKKENVMYGIEEKYLEKAEKAEKQHLLKTFVNKVLAMLKVVSK